MIKGEDVFLVLMHAMKTHAVKQITLMNKNMKSITGLIKVNVIESYPY